MTARLELHTPGAPRIALAPGDALLVEGDPAALFAALLGHGPGWARLDGQRLRGSVAARVRAGLGVVRDVPVAEDVPVREHLTARFSHDEVQRSLSEAPLLAQRAHDRAGVLSGGERTVLAWLRGLLGDPRAVLLDGAGVGLDRDTLTWAERRVARLRRAGTSVVIVPGRHEERRWAEDGQIVRLPA